MGAGQSTQASDPSAPPSTALHVLRVTPDSPASKTSIEPLFDFVVGFEDDSLASTIDVGALERIVEAHEGRSLNLLVWNAKSRETRVVPIVPSRTWSQASTGSAQDAQPSLLGLSMRMCGPEIALDTVWHVLDVLEGSPAESAGLVPYGDYITGWSGGVLSSENDFYDLVEAHIDKPLRVYVPTRSEHANSALREVVLVPNRQWGGEGLLGCVFGYGLLHRIPPQPAERIAGASTPPELHEPDDEYEEQELFVPADMPMQYPVPSARETTLLTDLRRQQDDEWEAEQLHQHQQQRAYRTPHVHTIQEEDQMDDEHEHDHDHDHGPRPRPRPRPRRPRALPHHTHQHEPVAAPSPPRRTASFNSPSFRRVSTGSPTPVFSAPSSRVVSAMQQSQSQSHRHSEDEDGDDGESLTSVD
ncbi:Golgi reassembly stacking protein 2 [Mycena chlorophos]|uniref:Golgi reassembly stacking protein 2 n=1 Tax=Mycena chlorophos TaxID=658473 RepID=A0A8H6VS12_MYCCL|nr:Golgi reassembly stacking protein 2 [Mycena chlorophos]